MFPAAGERGISAGRNRSSLPTDPVGTLPRVFAHRHPISPSQPNPIHLTSWKTPTNSLLIGRKPFNSSFPTNDNPRSQPMHFQGLKALVSDTSGRPARRRESNLWDSLLASGFVSKPSASRPMERETCRCWCRKLSCFVLFWRASCVQQNDSQLQA